MNKYELKIAYERQTGEDNPAKAKETYLIEGVTCTDVETRLLEYIKPFVFGGSDCEVLSCKRSNFFDIYPVADGGNWYKGRVELITVEDDGKETRKGVNILVSAQNINDALKTLQERLAALDCEIVAVTKSPIVDFLPGIA